MPVRRRKKALEKALHERLQRLTEHLDTAEVSEKSIDIVKEIKELHALARTLEQEGTSQDGDRKPPPPCASSGPDRSRKMALRNL